MVALLDCQPCPLVLYFDCKSGVAGSFQEGERFLIHPAGSAKLARRMVDETRCNQGPRDQVGLAGILCRGQARVGQRPGVCVVALPRCEAGCQVEGPGAELGSRGGTLEQLGQQFPRPTWIGELGVGHGERHAEASVLQILLGPSKRGPEIARLARAPGLRAEKFIVAALGFEHLAGPTQLLGSKSVMGFQKPISRHVVGSVGHDHRLLNESGKERKDASIITIKTHRLCALDREGSLKYGESPKQHRFSLRQQSVAPVDRRCHRLLALRRGARAGGEHPKSIVEIRQQLSL